VGIRNKTILVIALVVLAMGVALVSGAGWLAHRVSSDSEVTDMKVALDRSTAGITQDSDGLKVFVVDWAQWNDTYEYVAGRMPVYESDDLTVDTLKTVGMDFIAVTDLSGRIVGSIARDPRTHQEVPLPASLVSYLAKTPSLTQLRSINESVTGAVGLPEGTVLISAAAITNNNLTAQPNGTFIAGRFLSEDRVRKINGYTLVPMAIYSHGATSVPEGVAAAAAQLDAGQAPVLQPLADDNIAGYSTLRGIDGAQAAIVEVIQPRTSVVTARTALTQFTIAAIVLVALFLLVLGAVIDAVVLRRLGKLNDEVARVGAAGDASARVSVEGGDEIAKVGETVNGMLSELEASQSDLAYLANHDPLTRLYNRRRFETELDNRLAVRNAVGALLWFDLDHFKEVNDSLGHAAGDQLLSQLADLLSAETRGYCLLARLGGDEFGMLIPNAEEAEAVATAERLLDIMISKPFQVAGHEVRIGASVGIVTFPCEGESADDLLARADLAMYQAKGTGRNRVVVYSSDEDWRTEMTDRMGISAAIVSALRDDRMVLFAQPTRCMADDSAGAYELLLRMYAEDGSIVMPDQIIPTAERIGLIRDIDRWVIKRALKMLADETAAGRDTRFNVNMSATAFSDSALSGIVRETLAQAPVDPSRITIEITETAAIQDIQHAQVFIEELRAIGFRFALDDFGSGVSSFYYLKHLPVDDLKIDGSLVRNLATSEQDGHFLRAIVSMCKGLKINTVAEYVETEALLALVREIGVDYAQGYAVGYPAPFDRGPAEGA
jgi:diguanylate cyclase (GGDEF)-like protein